MIRGDDQESTDSAHDDDDDRTSRHCLAACCALALQVLFGLDRVAAEPVLQAGLAGMFGGATFGNARVLLARAFGVRAEVVSGTLTRMLGLSGDSGLVILGVNPRNLYEGAAPGRHAIILTSSSAMVLPRWSQRAIDPGVGDDSQCVTFIDASRDISSKQLTTRSALGAAFDAAGREALLITPVRTLLRTDHLDAVRKLSPRP